MTDAPVRFVITRTGGQYHLGTRTLERTACGLERITTQSFDDPPEDYTRCGNCYRTSLARRVQK